MKSLAAAAALALLPATCFAENLETTHLFGFTLGSDVNDVGEKEAESESTGRFGKGAKAHPEQRRMGQIHKPCQSPDP